MGKQCQAVTMMIRSLLLITILVISDISAQSCEGHCGDPFDELLPCQCNADCVSYNDCCHDYNTVCLADDNSCQGKCGDAYDPPFHASVIYSALCSTTAVLTTKNSAGL